MGYKIAIMGTGAVGAYAGAHMARAGEDVTFIDPWPANVETMKAKGLKVSHIRDVPEWSTPVRALHLTELQQAAKEKPFDIAFVCMKSYDTEWATVMISQYLAPAGFVVSLQNCMNEETIADETAKLLAVDRDVVLHRTRTHRGRDCRPLRCRCRPEGQQHDRCGA